MKRHIVTALFLVIVLTVSIAFAEDCSCEKGGLVFLLVNFLLGLVTERLVRLWDVTLVLVWASVWELTMVVCR
jgi:hypothetical protein